MTFQPPGTIVHSQTQIVGEGNVPQGKPDDGQNYASYTSGMQQASTPFRTAPEPKREAVKHTGKVDSQVLTVREALPRGGFMFHDFVVEHSGFGHWKITNAGPDEPFYTSLDDVKDAIRGQAYVGTVTFGTLSPSGEWKEE
jgi:hypothetical protein